MIRPVLTEIALFLTPFAIYALFPVRDAGGGVRSRVVDADALVWLTGAALALLIGSFILFAHFSGAPPGSTYEPAHIEDGKFVPGRTR